MLSVADARNQVLSHCRPLPAVNAALDAAARGRVLAESIASDFDVPPFDKALMDGYAVRSGDLPSGQGCLVVVEEVCAGQTPRIAVGPGQATRIMTGAPIPAGADAVIVVERARMLDDGRVEISDKPPRPGQNILPRAAEMRRGEMVVPAGSVLRPQEFGVLATVGRTAVMQVPAPRVSILSTGDELVEPDQTPGPGQIRNSNASMLLAQADRAGAGATFLGIGRDTRESLRPLIRLGLQKSDVLILSGGVSAGKLDLVPELLQEAGVEPRFHKIHMKPGKPLFFGTHRGGLVFGLPGNPVSSFVCFELFIRPALRTLGGHREVDLPGVTAVLTEDLVHRSDRPTYHPAWVESTVDGWKVKPVAWLGSADLRAFLAANALLVLPGGAQDFPAGVRLDVLRLDG
jgi:molybdopterin molybdotransferase